MGSFSSFFLTFVCVTLSIWFHSKLQFISYLLNHKIEIHFILQCKIWNYAKTPVRGVQDIEVCFDDYLLYRGFLPPSNPQPLQGKHTIVFSSSIIDKFGTQVIKQRKGGKKKKTRVFMLLILSFKAHYCGSQDQVVTLINNNKIVFQPNTPFSLPKTNTNAQERPATSCRRDA